VDEVTLVKANETQTLIKQLNKEIEHLEFTKGSVNGATQFRLMVVNKFPNDAEETSNLDVPDNLGVGVIVDRISMLKRQRETAQNEFENL